jgi:hypothetical protein
MGHILDPILPPLAYYPGPIPDKFPAPHVAPDLSTHPGPRVAPDLSTHPGPYVAPDPAHTLDPAWPLTSAPTLRSSSCQDLAKYGAFMLAPYPGP